MKCIHYGKDSCVNTACPHGPVVADHCGSLTLLVLKQICAQHDQNHTDITTKQLREFIEREAGK